MAHLAALLLLAVAGGELLRARGPAGEEVWWNPRDGIVVRGWDVPGGVALPGRGARPRFDAEGRRWVERSLDDGHRAHGTVFLVLERGASRFRPAAEGEGPPPWTAPVSPAARSARAAAGSAIRACVDP